MSQQGQSNFVRIVGVLRRNAWQAIPTILGIIILNFILMELVPGDAADVIAAESGAATEESMAQLRSHFGLDLPMLKRLGNYLLNIAQFDLGLSPRHNTSVATLIFDRLGNTLLLMGTALGVAVLTGALLGVLMSARAGKWQDKILSVLALLLYSTPAFWLGLMAIVLFSVQLGWFPTGGSHTIGAALTGWDLLTDKLRHLFLPAIAASGFYIAIFSRLTRASMLEVNRQDYVRTAESKGLSPARITFGHVLRNALIPVTTVAGMHFGALLGGATVIETVFSWPGLGRLALESVLARDYSVLLGILFLSSLLVIAANMLVDLLQAWLDPRIQVR
ncbi:MAG: ABC transporter permease [Burkholderiaceae bacterium]|jgi:peptide/nickel transport system permease protein|nr:ABC transporter permease [Burkholderiaceae bacterium]